MTVDSTVKTVEAQAATAVTDVKADISVATSFWSKYKNYILPAVSGIVGLIVGHKL